MLRPEPFEEILDKMSQVSGNGNCCRETTNHIIKKDSSGDKMSQCSHRRDCSVDSTDILSLDRMSRTPTLCRHGKAAEGSVGKPTREHCPTKADHNVNKLAEFLSKALSKSD